MPRRDVEEWFWQLGNEMNRLAEEMNQGRPKLVAGHAWEPCVDVFEDATNILVKAEIAGVRGEDIQLLYLPERHSLLIRGVREEGDPADGSRTAIHQLEIYYGEFQREVPLPKSGIDADGIRASYRNGFLLVMVPKQEGRVVVSRTITIRKV